MGDEKQTDDVQSDLSTATESLKADGDQKENGDTSKSDKVKSKIAVVYFSDNVSRNIRTYSVLLNKRI